MTSSVILAFSREDPDDVAGENATIWNGVNFNTLFAVQEDQESTEATFAPEFDDVLTEAYSNTTTRRSFSTKMATYDV